MTRRERISVVSTLVSVALSFAGAYEARDHLRTVDVVLLFFGGIGTGAGLAALAVHLRHWRLGRRPPVAPP